MIFMDILNVLGKDPNLERTQVVMYLIGGFHMHIVFFKAMNWTLQQHSELFQEKSSNNQLLWLFLRI